jgi:hypothetical protein
MLPRLTSASNHNQGNAVNSKKSTPTKQATAGTNSPKRKRRRSGPRGPIRERPKVRRGRLDGHPVVYVTLSAKGWRWGRLMILDAERWPMVVDLWGPQWVLMTSGNLMNAYVASGRVAVGPLSRTKGPRPVAMLGRLLTNARKGEVVCFENGDSLDLRYKNLTVMTKKEMKHWAPGTAAFLAHLTAAT